MLRSIDPEQVEAWREILCSEISEAWADVSAQEGALISRAFEAEQCDIFAGAGGPEAPPGNAIVSPANSFGDMGGGIDLVYRRRFGEDLERRVQGRIREEKAGELLVGDALVLETGDPVQFCIFAPTMRVPMDLRGSCNAYLAFRAVLVAVRQHNQLVARGGAGAPIERITSVLCPGLGAGIGLLPPRTVAYQMAMAYRQQVLQRHGCFSSASLDHAEMVKAR